MRPIQKDLILQTVNASQVAANCVLNASQANLAERELQQAAAEELSFLNTC